MGLFIGLNKVLLNLYLIFARNAKWLGRAGSTDWQFISSYFLLHLTVTFNFRVFGLL